MPSAKTKTPQEKKRLSLERDCRNVYGQSTRGSRRCIRRRKRWVNRTYRRSANQVLTQTEKDVEELASDVNAVHRKAWKKSPDMPLGKMLLESANGGLAHDLWQCASANPEILDHLQAWLKKSGLPRPEIRMVMRRVHAIALDRHPAGLEGLDLNITEVNLVRDFLKHRA